jgi:cardiolipin synthase
MPIRQDFGHQMQAMFDKDLAASRTIVLDAWEQRPLGDHMKEIAARMWGYWL